MRYYLAIFTAFLYGLTSCAQADKSVVPLIAPVKETFSYTLGNKVIHVNKSVYESEGGLAFVQLHHNEQTALLAAVNYLQQNGGVLYSIENKGERNISFRLHGKLYTFDPNRMFTRAGIRSSLKIYGHYSLEAENIVGQFAQFVLDKLPTDKPIIAVHNNTDKNYSVHSYLYDSDYKREAKDVVKYEIEDADNFFVTTDSNLHKFLKEQKFNSILLNKKAKDDGSLGYYFNQHMRTYINIEAQEGRLNQQIKMVETVSAVLK